IGTVSAPLGIPPEVLPMALIRPLSGSGGLAVLLETMKTYGPDSFIGFAVSIMSGSTETTFYVLAVYFGAIGVRVTRHTVFACLAADATGMVMAVALARLFY
ncbi:MAG: spore maturation protein, partial [Myxococcota bacterium]